MKRTLLYVILLAGVYGCSDGRIKGSGNRLSEERHPGSFDKVSTSGSNDVYIRYGDEYKVELKGSDNLIPYFSTRVQNGTLQLGYDRVNVYNDDIDVYLTMPVVKKVKQSGSSDIKISGNFNTQSSFAFESSGSGDIDVQDPFRAERVEIKVSGSSKADLKKIRSSEAEVIISGSAETYLNVEDALNVKISGSGKVYYKGSPAVSSKISGSGEVIKLTYE